MAINENDEWAPARLKMVECVARHFEQTSPITGLAQLDEPIRDALLQVPRHVFVPSESVALAYTDSALPIGYRQTISQPFIVALMLQLGEIKRGMRVLEVGTGAGYETAVLAQIAREVYSIELLPELAERATRVLGELGEEHVHIRSGDGFDGWPEEAPFDAVLVTACAEEIPSPLIEQLAVGGRMIIPVGHQYAYQELQVIEKTSEGEYDIQHGLPVAFVPLVHSE
jgi:protein-L-isoaspartate(D-aspartate) O-methyltransferase